LGKLIIYTDENVDVRISEGLKKRGITSFSAIKKGMSGSTDIQHFEYAARLKAVIFSHDHHFIEIARQSTQEGKDHWGVIFVEMNRLTVGGCIKRLSLYAEIFSAEEMKNQIEFL
jgi:predicted nuclease of predicted toxin-antitoxin system